MTQFTVFRKLPTELQHAIWLLALPGPEHEVCFVWPLIQRSWQDKKLVLPLMVDTAWPSVAHVCQDSRACIMQSGRIRLRESTIARMAVPCREFDPTIDTLYWGRSHIGFLEQEFEKPEHAVLVGSLRHIAVQLGALYPPAFLAELIRRQAVNMRTLALVVPDTSGRCSEDEFAPPARRCRLQTLPDDILDNSRLTEVPFMDRSVGENYPLRQYFHTVRGKMDNHVRKLSVPGDEGTAWSTPDETFSGLEIKAQVFVEYTAGEWVEVCKHRMLGQDGEAPQVPYIPKGLRRNPQNYRGLDDDCGRFGPEITHIERGIPDDYGLELGISVDYQV